MGKKEDLRMEGRNWAGRRPPSACLLPLSAQHELSPRSGFREGEGEGERKRGCVYVCVRVCLTVWPEENRVGQKHMLAGKSREKKGKRLKMNLFRKISLKLFFYF